MSHETKKRTTVDPFDEREIHATDIRHLSRDEVVALANWCQNQHGSSTEGLPAIAILALYHRCQDAGYPGFDEFVFDDLKGARRARRGLPRK